MNFSAFNHSASLLDAQDQKEKQPILSVDQILQQHQGPLGAIFQRLDEIQKLSKALTPTLSQLLPNIDFKIAHQRPEGLVILTSKATAARWIRMHEQKILAAIAQLAWEPRIQALILQVTPRLQRSPPSIQK